MTYKKEACPCKRKCERHGDCAACRAYHAQSKRKYPVACEKEDVKTENYEK